MKLIISLVVLLGTTLAAPQDFISTTSHLEARGSVDDPATARCVPGLYATKAKCRHHCHGRGHKCDFTPDTRPHWACVCRTADVETRAAAPEAVNPDIQDSISTGDTTVSTEDKPTEDDTDRHRRCIPGDWHTKKKCKRECYGRGYCQFTPDTRLNPWLCICPLD